MYIEDMRCELAEYYECAGFKDIYEREIKHKSNEEIIAMYKITFGDGAFYGYENLTIHAPAGSYAEQYAEEKGFKFVVD